jgi:UDP-N-acetylglucosamine--N-acetylmuramyl-(pentapeptide) pyrophosphoryl-undecaprenol N-acetylglucosamine transferase
LLKFCNFKNGAGILSMTFVVTGGGTGGHLTIAKALKEELVKRGHKAIFIGSSNGQDQSWFEDDNDFSEKIFLQSYGVTNQNGFGKLKSLLNIWTLSLQLRTIFKRNRVDAVISVGGYSSAPASIYSILSFTPLYIHEQNAMIGKLNKFIKPFSKAFFSSYEENSKIKDYPIGNIFFEKRRVREKIESVIFLGGSQGARFINDFAIKVAPELSSRGIKIIHQTGKLDFERMKRAYSNLDIEVELIDFHPKLSQFIEKSDLAVSRSGASTLWELSANGLPTIFIPYPHANNHQYYNAKFIIDKELGWLFPQKSIQPENLLEILNEDIFIKSKKLLDIISPKGVEKIINYIEKDLRK